MITRGIQYEVHRNLVKKVTSYLPIYKPGISRFLISPSRNGNGRYAKFYQQDEIKVSKLPRGFSVRKYNIYYFDDR